MYIVNIQLMNIIQSIHPEAIIFDLDGTLIHTSHLLEEAYMKAFMEHGFDLSSEKFKNWFRSDQSSPLLRSRSAEKLKMSIDSHYIEIISKNGVNWIDGVLDEIQKLHNKVQMAIFTNAPKSYIEAVSEHLPIKQLFKFIITLNDVAPKPSPEGILLCCRSMNTNPKNCMYVGDHILDMMTARESGSIGVLVPSEVTAPDAYKYASIVLPHLKYIHGYIGNSSQR